MVLQDFEPFSELNNYLKANPEQKEGYTFVREKFLQELIKKGFILEIKIYIRNDVSFVPPKF